MLVWWQLLIELQAANNALSRSQGPTHQQATRERELTHVHHNSRLIRQGVSFCPCACSGHVRYFEPASAFLGWRFS